MANLLNEIRYAQVLAGEQAVINNLKKKGLLTPKTMKAKIENRNGVDYLSFTPKGMGFPTTIPVITKGSRDLENAWTWNGSLETPTVRPSVRTQYTNEQGEDVTIHYLLNNGICQCLSDCTDGNENKNIELEVIV